MDRVHLVRPLAVIYAPAEPRRRSGSSPQTDLRQLLAVAYRAEQNRSAARRGGLKHLVALAATLAGCLLPSVALANPGGAGLPWESTFETILQSFQSIAQVLLVLALMAMFAALMFGEAAGLSRRALWMIVGGAGIVAAPGVVSALFTGATGVLL